MASPAAINRRNRKRQRQIRRSQRGHELKARRRFRPYTPRKWERQLFTPEITRTLVQRKPKTDLRVNLDFPAIWSIKENPEETISFLSDLENAFFVRKARTIFINHAVLERVTPEALLVLIAELNRLTEYSPKTRLHGIFKGARPEVLSMMANVGYLEYFGVARPERSDTSTHFIEHATGILTEARHVANLVVRFYDKGHLEMTRCRRLVKGLVECMQNVNHHAYRREIGRKLMGRWWLLGYVDESTGEIYFAFYDQGVGMPTTLRFKFRDKFFPELIGRSGCELIVAAFHGRFSSTGKRNRGLGLPRLKSLVDEAPDGELFVQSKECRVTLKPRSAPASSITQKSLEGTLLVWQVLVSTPNHDHDPRESNPD